MPLTLTKYGRIPYWEHTYIYSKDDLQNADTSQKKFYEEYKTAFSNGIYYDLYGNTNYCFILFFDLVDNYEHLHKELDRLKTELQTLGKLYPETNPYVTNLLIEIFVAQDQYAEAWNIRKQSGIYCTEDIIEFERALKKSLVDADVIQKIAGVKGLTSFGKKHVSEIADLSERQVRKFEKEKGRRLTLNFITKTKWEKYNLSEYEKYYADKKIYTFYSKIDISQAGFRRGSTAIPHTVSHALQAFLQTIMRNSEDEYRESCGLPKIGEGWIGETELYYFIKEFLPKCTVVHHARPKWLAPQHLDILIQDYNIAIEYQGEQHFRPIERFGGEEAYQNNVKRDAIKRKKCEANGCELVYFDKTHDQEYVKTAIRKLIRKPLK